MFTDDQTFEDSSGISQHDRLLHEVAIHRRFLEMLPAAAYECDAGGLITIYNKEAVKLWGREPTLNDPEDRFCGSFNLFAADGTPLNRLHSWMGWALREEHGSNQQEIIIERPDGSRRVVLAQANPIRDESGNLTGAFNLLVDITERKQTAHRVGEKEDFVEAVLNLHTSRELTEQQQFQTELRRMERLALLGTLAAGIAHEINNPMSAAWTAAETAKAVRNKPGAERLLDQSLSAVSDAVCRCRMIVENVVRLARQESSQKVIQDLNVVVRRAAETTAHYVNAHDSSIELLLAENLAQPSINATEIEQVLVNLIRNAVEAGDRTRVAIRTEQGDRQVHVHVEDNGRGIPDADLDHVFDSCFTASDKTAGTGLGLSISHAIVDDHQGTITVESTSGRGTTFSVTLPVSFVLPSGEDGIPDTL